MSGETTVLPPLRQELDLLEGPRAFNGAPTWSVYDPANQRFYRIGQTECEILLAWEQGSIENIVQSFNDRGLISITEEHVAAMYTFLYSHNLLKVQGSEATQFLLKQARAAKQHWLTWLIHHYLFIRIPLVRPDRFLKQTYSKVSFLFNPIVLQLLLLILAVNLYVLIDRWELFSQTFLHFFTFQGIIFYFFALTLAKILHELGHAYTAHHYGCRVASMGVAFLVMFPVLYTDTSDAWKLSSKKKRLAIASAGIAVELALAVVSTTLWHFLPDGTFRSGVFLLATTTWIMTLLVNLNPFMRFDGYYILSDFLEVENLQNRAFALARWQMRQSLFGMKEVRPELFPVKLNRILILYAWGTWLYRLILFLGIALLVYHFFFKVLGLILMLVEIIWFIALPISKELKYWFDHRESINLNKKSFRTILIIILLLCVLFVPWQSRIEAPAVLKAAIHTDLYMPLSGKLTNIKVRTGEQVRAGQVLIQFSSSDIDLQLERNNAKIRALRWQLSFHGQDKDLSNRQQITQSELESAMSEQKGLLDEREKLSVKSPFDGIVLNINDQLNPGEWVAQDETLISLAQFNTYEIEAYVQEDYLGQILHSQQAVFYPEQLDWHNIGCLIFRRDNVASDTISPEYASIYSGSIPVKGQDPENLIPETSVYRVWLQTDKQKTVINRAIRGSVMIAVPAESYASYIWKRVLAVLIRETGF